MEQKSQIRAATYNVGLLRLFLRDWVPFVKHRSDLLPQALSQLITQMKSDIIFLQEVWSENCANKLSHFFNQHDFHIIRPHNQSLLGTGLLLAIRRGFHIDQVQFCPFQNSTSFEQFAKKGFISVRAKTPQSIPFHLLGTHLQSISTLRGSPKKKHEVLAHREQTLELKQWIEEQGHQDTSTLLLGDFNVGPSYVQESFDFLKDSLNLSEVPSEEPTWDQDNPLVHQGWNAPEPSALIDHCFVRHGKSTHWRIHSGRVAMQERYDIGKHPIPLSDHYALTADLELTGLIAQ